LETNTFKIVNMIIRPFKSEDNSSLLDLEKLCPHGNESYAINADRSPDVTARYKIYNNWNLLVAEEDGKIVGSVGWTVKGQDRKYVYLAEINVHPDFQRGGIASKLLREVEENTEDADHIYCYVVEPNTAARSLFKNLGYSKIRDVKAFILSAYRKMDLDERFKIKKVDENEIPDVVNLLNSYHSNHEHFTHHSPESFKHHLNSILAYGMENFWVAKDENDILACAGLWDCSKVVESYLSKEPFMLKLMGTVYRFLGKFRKTPYLARKGERLKLVFTADHAFKNYDAMASLTAHFNNLLVDWGRNYMMTHVDPDDDLLNIIKGWPHVDTLNMFSKGNKPDSDAFYVDVRDLIP